MTIGSHQTTVGKSQAHFTPRFILDALGPFDLDPCAGNPRPWDCAAENWTEMDDGLSRTWHDRVWLNPPFHRYQVGSWIGRLAHHGRGTALLHARTETEWFQPIWRSASEILFLGQRLKFCRADGSAQPANSGAPIVIVAFGSADAAMLRASGLKGAFVNGWRVAA